MRLFLAFYPDSELNQALAELARGAQHHCGGRCLPQASLHLTLAFLGEVDETQGAALARWVGGLSCTPGEWTLDRWGYFGRSRVVWLGSSASQPELLALHRRLWRQLETFGVKDEPRPFQPHVTLLRKARRAPPEALDAPRLTWRYRHVRLVESRPGSRYRTLAMSA